MPEEVLILLLLTTAGTIFLIFSKMILSHRKSVHEAKTGTSSGNKGEMTTSELELMMTRAVENAMVGLHGKVEDLELEIARLSSSSTTKKLPEASKARLQFDPDELEDEVVEVGAVRRSQSERS